MRSERICSICGNHYDYCPSCGIGSPKERWRNIYCSENCKNIFDILSKWKNTVISSVDADKALKELHIDSIKLNEYLQSDVDAIKAATTSIMTDEDEKRGSLPKFAPKKKGK